MPCRPGRHGRLTPYAYLPLLRASLLYEAGDVLRYIPVHVPGPHHHDGAPLPVRHEGTRVVQDVPQVVKVVRSPVSKKVSVIVRVGPAFTPRFSRSVYARRRHGRLRREAFRRGPVALWIEHRLAPGDIRRVLDDSLRGQPYSRKLPDSRNGSTREAPVEGTPWAQPGP